MLMIPAIYIKYPMNGKYFWLWHIKKCPAGLLSGIY